MDSPAALFFRAIEGEDTVTAMVNDSPQEQLADVADLNPWFLGYALSRWRNESGLDRGTQAAQLGVTREDLVALELSPMPSAPHGSLDWFSGLVHLSERYGCDVDVLQAMAEGGIP